MRVIVVPSDNNAPGYYRCGLPAMTLTDQGEGIDFTFAGGLPMVDAYGKPAVPGVTEPVALHPDVECDVLVLQRPMVPYQLVALETAQARGIRVVVEVDDDVHATDKRSAFGASTTAAHLRVFEQCCAKADLVTVSTPALARKYGGHGRVVVLPNYVPEAWLGIDSVTFDSGEDATEWLRGSYVGWTGSIGNHIADLEAARGGVGNAVTEAGAVFRCYGHGNRKSRDHISRVMRVSDVEILPWQGMDRYPHEIARLDVGIAPLADTPFNRSKSWLKPLEYAACGVPCVMSATDEYRRIHDDHGIGVLARHLSPGDWKREVGRLLTDAEYRAEKGERDRAAVREHLTIEKNAFRWAEAWASTLVYA